ncbi:hypothetical protein [Stygiolobus caldivivus]|uniref:Uncharacterized protein n=1 Tax=Stygiolobus caldivivus TaxID=2824673 RepID=A0A8D5U7G8_9CREN|nr:hypothetical protein [Stygiolobus caldivivus]BCU70976.1 hypothetical protein KN1_22730 [Stygiolobus caldivivus]
MLIKVPYKTIKVFPSEIKGKYVFMKDTVVIIKTQSKVLYVDCVHENLGNYRPPPFLSNYIFEYEIMEGGEHCECVARALQEDLKPLFKNQKLCKKGDITVVIER